MCAFVGVIAGEEEGSILAGGADRDGEAGREGEEAIP